MSEEHIHLFEPNIDGNWVETQVWLRPDGSKGTDGDLNFDGTALLLSDQDRDEGKIYVYTQGIDGNWSLDTTLTPTENLEGTNSFGVSIDIDRGRVIAGARFDVNQDINTGSVYFAELASQCTSNGACYCREGASGNDCSERSQCGDGVLDAVEACDDGNDADGDGCSASCELEPGFYCEQKAITECEQRPTCASEAYGCPEHDFVPLNGASFNMGDAGAAHTIPVHGVTVADFELMRSEVTVSMYTACVQAGHCDVPACDETTTFMGEPSCNYVLAGKEDHPINYVTFAHAQQYADLRLKPCCAKCGACAYLPLGS